MIYPIICWSLYRCYLLMTSTKIILRFPERDRDLGELQSIHQMPLFRPSTHLYSSSVSVHHSVPQSTLSRFVSPSNIFSRCFRLLRFPSIIPVVIRCSSFSLLTTWPKKVAWRLCILITSHLVMSASHNIVSFDFFAVHEIYSVLRRNHICVASSLFSTPVLNMSRPRIHTPEWVQYSTP